MWRTGELTCLRLARGLRRAMRLACELGRGDHNATARGSGSFWSCAAVSARSDAWSVGDEPEPPQKARPAGTKHPALVCAPADDAGAVILASCRLVAAVIAAFFDAGASHATRASSAAGGEISRRRREGNFKISPVAADTGGFSGCGISTH